MLNEDKIKLMTKLAVYEKRTGKKTMKMTKYFRSDYISWNIIKTALAVTIAYAMMAGIWLLYHMEEYIAELYSMDFAVLIRSFLVSYIQLLVVYLVAAFLIYQIKYTLAMKSLKRYGTTLKRLKQADSEESKGR